MSDGLGFLLHDVARHVRRAFDARARSIGVTRPQWRVLLTLAREEGINQGTLADRLDVEPITVARMVDRLQDAGYVERRADPADRRAWRLYLTPRSREIISQLRTLGEALMNDILDGFTETEQATLIEYLNRLRANATRQLQEKAANG